MHKGIRPQEEQPRAWHPWRLPWITTCTTHGTYLTDAHTTQPPKPAPDEAIARTHHFNTLLADRTVAQLGQNMKGNDAFDLWRAAIQLAARCHDTTANATGCRDTDSILATVAPLITATDLDTGAATITTWCRGAGIAQPYRSALTAPHPLLQACITRASHTRTENSDARRHPTNAHQATIDWLTQLGQPHTPDNVARLRPYVHRYPPGTPERRAADILVIAGRTPTRAAIRNALWH